MCSGRAEFVPVGFCFQVVETRVSSQGEMPQTSSYVLSAVAEAARPRFAMRGYIGKGQASLLSQPPVFNPEATSRPSAGRAHSRTVTLRDLPRSHVRLPRFTDMHHCSSEASTPPSPLTPPSRLRRRAASKNCAAISNRFTASLGFAVSPRSGNQPSLRSKPELPRKSALRYLLDQRRLYSAEPASCTLPPRRSHTSPPHPRP